jgi:hypothetical protein
MLTPGEFLTPQTPDQPQPLPFSNPNPHQGLGLGKGKGIGHDELTPGLPMTITIQVDDLPADITVFCNSFQEFYSDAEWKKV